MDAHPREELRPPLSLRISASVIGSLCAMVGAHQTWLGLLKGEPARLLVVLILLMPTLFALSVLSRRISLEDSELHSRSLLSSRRVGYGAIRRVDKGRSAVMIESAAGPVTSTWLSPSDRDRLLRTVIERARLIRTVEEPPYGVLSRYVPRAKEISFIPHHARKQTDSADSGDVVS